MKKLDPYLRYIAIASYWPNKEFVKAYDCRLFFVLSGKGELRTEVGNFPLSENTLAYYPSGLEYFFSSSVDEPLSFVTVNFDFTRSYPERSTTLRPVKISDFSPALERPTYNELSEDRFGTVFTVDHAFFVRDDLLALASLFRRGELYTDELCSSLLKCIVLKIANHFSSSAKENRTVRRIMDFVDENRAERLDNHTIADRFGYHPYYVSSLFKSNTGMTLHQYVLESRLKHACELLLSADMSIGEIAVACGFQSANHFSVKFKNRYGNPPIDWRRINSVI